MALKRKPPVGNVRRVAPIEKNLRYAITSKANETIQCESFQERKLTLLFDRDPTVQEYRSQPERFSFTDSQGTSHTYVPDFIVWKTTGEIEIHEVTLTSRQEKWRIAEREKATREICRKRGWSYIVHTEETLPQPTEEANLLALYRYRPTVYANPAVTAAVRTRLVQGISQERRFQVSCPTYYKYVNLYDTYHGNEAAIAASFRRATFRLPQMSKAQLHFIDTCLLLYYGNTRSTKTRVYRLASDILEKRTQGYWIDPEKCGATIPQNIVTELLDLSIPLQALLENPEKKGLLTKIEMPSIGWFSGYTRYVEAQPDQGERLITQRLGKGIWEQFHLVFDTFVHRAQFPLQYVFADHWLLDAWIVDEETRQQTSRLWLTLLIDAYSRSILGMALLSEDPCIESIQQALKHAIWEKTSHQAVGIEKEWGCHGIPMQLFLDNAWAHHSHSLENLARVLSRNGIYNSIDLVFRPPYKGRYGAIIERLFKNFSGQVKELVAGAIASSNVKAVRAAANSACFLYADMNCLLHRLIVIYQHTPHRELHGLTPHQKWCEGVQSSGFPLVPPFTPAMDRLFLRMDSQTRTVRSKGIAAFGLNYWSAQLGGIERVDRTGQAVQYNFCYDPTDISRISVFRNGEWVGDGNARELQ